jgi:hypothetical protein
MQDPD